MRTVKNIFEFARLFLEPWGRDNQCYQAAPLTHLKLWVKLQTPSPRRNKRIQKLLFLDIKIQQEIWISILCTQIPICRLFSREWEGFQLPDVHACPPPALLQSTEPLIFIQIMCVLDYLQITAGETGYDLAPEIQSC